MFPPIGCGKQVVELVARAAAAPPFLFFGHAGLEPRWQLYCHLDSIVRAQEKRTIIYKVCAENKRNKGVPFYCTSHRGIGLFMARPPALCTSSISPPLCLSGVLL